MADEVTVVRDADQHRYEAVLDGVVVGFTAYRERPGQVVLRHTKVDQQYEGRGFGSQLARGALADIQAQGKQVVPVCPFIAGYLQRHPEYAEMVAAVGDERD